MKRSKSETIEVQYIGAAQETLMDSTDIKARITFLTRSLNYGGAETQLVALARGLHHLGHSVQVVVFYADGPLEQVLRAAGVPVQVLRKAGRWDIVGFLLRLAKIVYQQKPDVLHGYLVVPNILTVLLKVVSPRSRIVWGIRDSNLDLNRYDWLTRVLYRLECALARFPDLNIVNSYAGLAYAAAHGFPRIRMVVIPNGIDTERFRPDSNARIQMREKWGMGDDVKLIGLVGRFDPMKDHPTFIRAAAQLTKERNDVRFVCVGDGPSIYRQKIMNLCEELRVLDYFKFPGKIENMPAVYNAIDMLISSSSCGEGFSNVIGEAMASKTPCLVTDVGDSKWIVGENGHIVTPKNANALKMAIELLLNNANSNGHRGDQDRERIVSNFSIQRMVLATEAALLNILNQP